MCRMFVHKLREDVFNLITHFEMFVTDLWSLTTNRKVMLWRSASDQEYSVDKLVMKACFLF